MDDFFGGSVKYDDNSELKLKLSRRAKFMDPCCEMFDYGPPPRHICLVFFKHSIKPHGRPRRLWLFGPYINLSI